MYFSDRREPTLILSVAVSSKDRSFVCLNTLPSHLSHLPPQPPSPVMAIPSSHRGQKGHDNVVSAFFNSFMSAGEQKFTVVSSFFSSGLFLVALALVKQLSR